MNFSSVPRTSSRVEEDSSFAEYLMSRNCAREPDAKRSYRVPCHSRISHPSKGDEAHIDYKVRIPIYILVFAIYLS
jgi:hypothetical protein